MRLTIEMIAQVARRMVDQLVTQSVLEIPGKTQDVEAVIRRVITTELKREDELDAEVRNILQDHAKQMLKSDVSYERMFHMVKTKLAKERGIEL